MQIVLYITLPVVGIVLGWTIRWLYARFQLSAAEQKAERVKQDAVKEAEAQKKYDGRFGPGLPAISDGQMLFMLNGVKKMKNGRKK